MPLRGKGTAKQRMAKRARRCSKREGKSKGGQENLQNYHKWSLTICDGCFDTLKSSKM